LGNPGSSKLVNYADNEIGDPTIGLEVTGAVRAINGPIVVPHSDVSALWHLTVTFLQRSDSASLC
jgi:hypothetical protein